MSIAKRFREFHSHLLEFSDNEKSQPNTGLHAFERVPVLDVLEPMDVCLEV